MSEPVILAVDDDPQVLAAVRHDKSINEVGLDHYLLKPWDPPEDSLYALPRPR